MFFLLVSFVMCSFLCAQEDRIILAAHEVQSASVKLYVGVIAENLSQPCIDRVLHDLSYSKQCALTVEPHAPVMHKSEIVRLMDRDCALALFISHNGHDRGHDRYEWRLYDTIDGTMLAGKKYAGDDARLADRIAHDIWYALMHESSVFETSLAYIKKIKGGRIASELRTCAFDGIDDHLIVKSSRILVAPVWGKEVVKPYVMVSEFTPVNVRLRTVGLDGASRVALDLDGTCVGVSFGAEPHEVVYCRSGEIWKYHYDSAAHKSVHMRVIALSEPCSSPRVMPSGDIIFCSQGKIYIYEIATGNKRVLTQGYCVAPDYCARKKSIVYSKRINGVMQLCCLDLATGMEKQITSDKGDKIDPVWSPCGSYVACCYDMGKRGRIMTVNIHTGIKKFITSEQDDCGYPAWSQA